MTMDLDPELDLVLTRALNAPREILYSAGPRPNIWSHFFVPKPHKVTACDLDLRVGGQFNTTFDVDGNEMENNGVYLEVVPNEKLVFTDAYTEGWKPAPEPFMTAILTFEDIGDGRTNYTAIARHRNADTAKAHKDMGFYDGWGTVVTQLEAYAQGPEAMSRDAVDRFATLTFERQVAAPLATLWQAWTAPAARAVWASPAPAVTVEFLEADSPGRRAARSRSARSRGSPTSASRRAGWTLRPRRGQRGLRGDLASEGAAIGGAGHGGFLRRWRRAAGSR